MKRILNVIGSLDIGGAENSAMNICRFIDHNIFQYDFLIFGDKVGAYEKEAIEKGATIIRMNQPQDNYFAFIKELTRVVKKNSYHAIHVNTLWNSGIILRVARKNNVPVRICHSHSTESSKNENFVYKLYKHAMRRMIKKNATEFIACGKDAGEYLYGKDFFNTIGKVIYNGIDIEKYAYSNKKSIEMKEELGVQKQEVLLGHVGRLAPVKNHKFMIEVFEKAIKEIPNLRMVFVGDGPDKEFISKMLENKKLNEKVTLLGNRSDVDQLLSAMDILLFPSIFEGFPVTLVEAQATGIPCLVSNKVTQETDLTDKIYFMPIDEGEDIWIAKLKELINFPIVRENVSIKKISNEFEINTIVKKMEGIYLDRN